MHDFAGLVMFAAALAAMLAVEAMYSRFKSRRSRVSHDG